MRPFLIPLLVFHTVGWIGMITSGMFIYVIGTSEKVKIGYTGDLETRLRALQCGNPDKLQVYHTALVPEDRALIMERKIHRELGHYRIRGEWFRMTPEFARSQVDYAMIRWLDDPLLD